VKDATRYICGKTNDDSETILAVENLIILRY
jgi:hypothetical protein